MFLLESPLSSANFPYKKFGGVFNWTMTYRRDSDVESPYGWVKPIGVPNWSPYLPLNYTDSVTAIDSKLRQAVKVKKKKVAWIVTNCLTHSQREDYVLDLRKHIQVDIYGGCGKHLCKELRGQSCHNQIQKDYKFYLAFENSWCTDYVTEKFWWTLNSTMLPVVMGGADYASIAPPNSYIDASKLKPEQLAAKLKALDADDEKLLRHMAWKTKYMVSPNKGHRFCDLCRKLNEPSIVPKTYGDLDSWWNVKGKCQRKGSFPWSNPPS